MRVTTTLKRAGLLLAAAGLLGGAASLLNVWSGNKAEAAPVASASSQAYFLKLDGVPGESTDVQHTGEIDINSFVWSKDGTPGVENPASASSGGGAGRATVHDIYLTQNVSKASPLLMQTTTSGKHFPSAVITVRKAGKQQLQYVVIKLSDVTVSSYRLVAKDGLPTDEFSLSFAKLEYDYTPQKADGTADTPVIAGWDFKANQNL